MNAQAQSTFAGFKIGDRVILKSGGLSMTVIGISPNGRLWCEWDHHVVGDSSFTPDMLEAAQSPSNAPWGGTSRALGQEPQSPAQSA